MAELAVAGFENKFDISLYIVSVIAGYNRRSLIYWVGDFSIWRETFFKEIGHMVLFQKQQGNGSMFWMSSVAENDDSYWYWLIQKC